MADIFSGMRVYGFSQDLITLRRSWFEPEYSGASQPFRQHFRWLSGVLSSRPAAVEIIFLSCRSEGYNRCLLRKSSEVD